MDLLTYLVLGIIVAWSGYYIFKKIKSDINKGKCGACNLGSACGKEKWWESCP